GRGVRVENDQVVGSVPIGFGGGDLDGDAIPDFGLSVFEKRLESVTNAEVDFGRIVVIRGKKNLPDFLPLSLAASDKFGFELSPTSLELKRRFGSNVRVVPDEDGDGRAGLFVASNYYPSHAFVMAPGPQDEYD